MAFLTASISAWAAPVRITTIIEPSCLSPAAASAGSGAFVPTKNAGALRHLRRGHDCLCCRVTTRPLRTR